MIRIGTSNLVIVFLEFEQIQILPSLKGLSAWHFHLALRGCRIDLAMWTNILTP